MKIGIMGAMIEEVGLVKNDMLSLKQDSRGGRDFFLGSLYGRETVLVFSRWGKVSSASTATTLIDSYSVDLIIFTGVAGAASPELEIGDIVVAKELVQHDLDPRPIFKQFEVPLLGLSKFTVVSDLYDKTYSAVRNFLQKELFNEIDSRLVHSFNIKDPKILSGLIGSGDQFIADPTKLGQIRAMLPDILCVEMEGAAVAQVCYEHGVPFTIVRAISDKADHSAEIDFTRFISEISNHYSRGILRNLLPLI